MTISVLYVLAGLGVLVKSADLFVRGSAAVAGHLGMSPLLIGMIVVGFGTSAPEMLVSGVSSFQGNPGLALGNAYGSNICNIALILGTTALIRPVLVTSGILKKELPVLAAATIVSALMLYNGSLSRWEAVCLLLLFSGLLAASLVYAGKTDQDKLGVEVSGQMEKETLGLKGGIVRTVVGLLLLIASSRLLVTGSVSIAKVLGVSDLMIGLTIVALGTSLPELASSVTAALRNEHEIAFGNIIGSNLFNTLCVVGIAGVIRPMSIESSVLFRDVPVMSALTASLFITGYGFKGRPGRINRLEGLVLLLAYLLYTGWIAAGYVRS